MGLAAQQARLLTITARKADCEYDSMRLSHEKLSISRDLEKISNEYQNSLDQTKLMYDFYGNGTSSEQLRYNLLMSPSALNDYLPITVTNTAGRVVLNSSYAAAAKAAGIPQEGLGCVPSSAVRYKFLMGLGDAGIIDPTKAKQYANSTYNQTLGIGSSSTEGTYTTVTGNLDDLKDALGRSETGVAVDYPAALTCGNNGNGFANPSGTTSSGNLTLTKLLSDDPNEQVIYYGISENGYHFPNNQAMEMADNMTKPGGFIDQLYKGFASVLTTGDSRSTAALNYAKQETEKLFAYSHGTDFDNGQIGDSREGSSNDEGIYNLTTSNGHRPKKQQENDAKNNILSTATDYVGITSNSYWKGGAKGGHYNSAAAINLNNVAKAFLSFFAKYMEGLPTNSNDKGEYHAEKGTKYASNFVTYDATYTYYFPGASTLPEEDTKNITFYDTLLNQICTSGWTENNEIEDPKYLQQMLQNGMMFVTKIKDDGYYYQGNYATDSYIKEVTDETAVAQAEARYNTNKAKLNSKEQTLDLKMKNLDTEISSLTTEYDTVKNTISKNIEKSFKRYNA